MPFGQVVIGPPGSGKTTYCHGMQQFLRAIHRKVAIINMDPANDGLPYECDVDISELVRLEDVMTDAELGPNGGLLFCLEFIEQNLDWLQQRLAPLGHDTYCLFDFPGQVELFTAHGSTQRIIAALQTWGYRLTAVHLVDSLHCCHPSNYIAALLLSLSTMLHLELPHVNVLSKIDLIEQHGSLPFDIEFFTEVQDLSYLRDCLGANTSEKFRRLNEAICGIVDEFRLVSFYTLDVQDKHSMMTLLSAVDKANGCIYGALDPVNDHRVLNALTDSRAELDLVGPVREKYLRDTDEELLARELALAAAASVGTSD